MQCYDSVLIKNQITHVKANRPGTKFIHKYRKNHHVKFRHSMARNWSIMTARAQMELVKLEEFNLKGMKSTED